MKKILHISNYYYPHVGGIESTAKNIVELLQETHKYEQVVVCFGDGPNIVNDIPIIRIPFKMVVQSQAISLRYRRLLKKTMKIFNPDIVILHTPNPLVEFYFNTIKFYGKIIVYHHLDIYRQKVLKQFVKPTTSKTNKRADVIVCSSQKYIDGSKELRKYKDKCVVIPLSFKQEEIELKDNEKNEVKKIRDTYKDKTIIFYSGRHASFKGVRYALKAIEGMDDVIFLIGRVGPIHGNLIRKINRCNNAVSLGLLDRDQFRIYLNTCDFFIFPSLTKNESFGITLLEAIASGKPCITFNIPGSGVNYVSLNNVTGIECDNKSVIELRKAILTLKNNKKLREEYSDNGIKRANELFSFDKFKKSFIKLVDNLIKDIK